MDIPTQNKITVAINELKHLKQKKRAKFDRFIKEDESDDMINLHLMEAACTSYCEAMDASIRVLEKLLPRY